MGLFQPLHKVGVKFTGGGSASSTETNKGRADKCKMNYAYHLSDALTVDKNMHKCMAPD